MTKYRKLPVVIEAFQMTEDRRRDSSEWPEWLHKAWNEEVGMVGACWPEEYPCSLGTDNLMLGTLEGSHRVGWGDWIIKGVKGELYPCKPDVFEATYEKVN